MNTYINDVDDIKSQCKFCTELMLRLNAEIQDANESSYCGIIGHTIMQADIIRLRRELNDLRKMLNQF